jgi:hypothetical protein
MRNGSCEMANMLFCGATLKKDDLVAGSHHVLSLGIVCGVWEL